MGHWVTTDEGNHVYISNGGKVLATRGAISSAAGGKERGLAMAQRSKAAVGKATGRTAKAPGRGTAERAAKAAEIHHQRAAAAKVLGTWEGVRGKGEIKLYHGTSIANVKGIREQGLTNFGTKGYSMLSTSNATALNAANAKGSGVVLEYRVPGKDAAKYIERGERANGIRGGKDVYAAVKPGSPLPGQYLKGAQVPKSTIEKVGTDKIREILKPESPATTRAIEHARAAGPSLGEQAEKARAAKGSADQRKARLDTTISQRVRDAMSKKNAPRTQAAGKIKQQTRLDRLYKTMKSLSKV